MKTIRGVRPFILLFPAILLFILLSCATTSPPYEISKNYQKQKYQRIALLVVRVGNDSHLGCPVPITVNTDYSTRKPKLDSEFNSISPGQYVAKTDVYIEDEDRLRESLPAYPDYAGLRPAIRGSWVAKYYKNITPQIYKAVSDLLVQKGYHVVNVKEAAASFPKKASEMKIGEIVDALKKDVDAVLIIHYADIGYYYYRAGRKITGGSEIEMNGFVGLNYVVAMYDAGTKEQLLSFAKIMSGYGPPMNLETIAWDPDIRNDPERAKKITVEGHSDSLARHSKISHSFSEDEVIGFVMRYLCKGVDIKTGESSWKWIGLAEIIP